MTISIRDPEILALLRELQQRSGQSAERALKPVLEAEIENRRRTAAGPMSDRKPTKYELSESPDEFLYGPLPRVYANHLDETPQARIARLLAMIGRDWKPIPPGTKFENADEVLGFDVSEKLT